MTQNHKSTIANRQSQISVTLLELLIATTILALIIIVGGGIYLSGWNIFREAQYLAQSHRNAVIPMAHMIKHLQGAITFTRVAGPPLELRFTVNPLGTPTTSRYIFNRNNQNQIEFDSDTSAGGEQSIGTHIRFDVPNPTTFTVSANNIVATITITAEDNRGQNHNRYTTTSTVEARYGSTPPV